MVTDDRDSNDAPRAQDAAQNAAQEPAGGTPHDAPQHPIDDTLDVREARALADRMRRLAGSIARQQAQFLELLDEIDRTEAWAHWIGIRTLVQWVSFVCEMDAHTAREHIRVMRGLRAMPTTAGERPDLVQQGPRDHAAGRSHRRRGGRGHHPAGHCLADLGDGRRLSAPGSCGHGRAARLARGSPPAGHHGDPGLRQPRRGRSRARGPGRLPARARRLCRPGRRGAVPG